MKLNGVFGKGTGKVGESVWSVNHGEQIISQYNPNKSNPNTAAQVAQRARFKLASQVSAAMASVIAIPRDGIYSPRNQFVKRNMRWIYGSSQGAQVSYENLQLTAGAVALPTLIVDRGTNNHVLMRLAEDASKLASRVCYCLFTKSEEGLLMLADSVVIEDAGVNGSFPAEFGTYSTDVVGYAYAMRDLNERATATYGSYSVASGEDLAKLLLSRKLNESDYQITQTRGTTLFAGDATSSYAPSGKVMVYITSGGGGTVSGAGFSNGRQAVDVGDSVTVVATPSEGYEFQGWYINGDEVGVRVSTSTSYTFNASQQTDLIAIFRNYVPGLE